MQRVSVAMYVLLCMGFVLALVFVAFNPQQQKEIVRNPMELLAKGFECISFGSFSGNLGVPATCTRVGDGSNEGKLDCGPTVMPSPLMVSYDKPQSGVTANHLFLQMSWENAFFTEYNDCIDFVSGPNGVADQVLKATMNITSLFPVAGRDKNDIRTICVPCDNKPVTETTTTPSLFLFDDDTLLFDDDNSQSVCNEGVETDFLAKLHTQGLARAVATWAPSGSLIAKQLSINETIGVPFVSPCTYCGPDLVPWSLDQPLATSDSTPFCTQNSCLPNNQCVCTFPDWEASQAGAYTEGLKAFPYQINIGPPHSQSGAEATSIRLNLIEAQLLPIFSAHGSSIFSVVERSTTTNIPYWFLTNDQTTTSADYWSGSRKMGDAFWSTPNGQKFLMAGRKQFNASAPAFCAPFVKTTGTPALPPYVCSKYDYTQAIGAALSYVNTVWSILGFLAPVLVTHLLAKGAPAFPFYVEKRDGLLTEREMYEPPEYAKGGAHS
jgi:hypothetical protein